MNITNYPEPEGSIVANETGSTTLKQCGWCNYCSGTHRYNYCIEGTCELLKSYSKRCHWDDECVFKNASKSDIRAIVDNHKYTIESSEQNIKSHKEYIKTLLELINKAPKRPPLPDDRSHDHFNVGDPIAVWCENKWYFGEVQQGYRHHEGCVSYRLDGIGPQSISFWGSGYAVPTVMLESEYDFFKDNSEQYKQWITIACEKDYNGKKLNPPSL